LVARRGGRRRRRWKVEKEGIELERTTKILEENLGRFWSKSVCYRSSEGTRNKDRSARGKVGKGRRAREG